MADHAVYSEDLHLSSALPDLPFTAGGGLDRGGTLTKLVLLQRDADSLLLRCLTFRHDDFSAALTALQQAAPTLDPPRLHITGMGAVARREEIARAVGSGVTVEQVAEHVSMALGALLLLRRGLDQSHFLHPGKEIDPARPFILLHTGSGVGVVKVSPEAEIQRLGGTTIGGTVLLGLSQALLGHSDYQRLMERAEAGDSNRINVHVRDLVAEDRAGQYSFLSPDFLLYPFGKLTAGAREEVGEAELANAAVHLVAMPIAFEAARAARQNGVETVIMTGNLVRHQHFQRQLENIFATVPGPERTPPRFFKSGCVGAVGALIATPE